MKNCKLNWEYCECGCKCYTCIYLGFDFSYYWDLGSKHYLTLGGHLGTRLGVFSTPEAVDKAAAKYAEENYRTIDGLIPARAVVRLRTRARRRYSRMPKAEQGETQAALRAGFYDWLDKQLAKILEEA
jgi:hypothetical protein